MDNLIDFAEAKRRKEELSIKDPVARDWDAMVAESKVEVERKKKNNSILRAMRKLKPKSPFTTKEK